MKETLAAITLVNHLPGAKNGWRWHTKERFDASDSRL